MAARGTVHCDQDSHDPSLFRMRSDASTRGAPTWRSKLVGEPTCRTVPTGGRPVRSTPARPPVPAGGRTTELPPPRVLRSSGSLWRERVRSRHPSALSARLPARTVAGGIPSSPTCRRAIGSCSRPIAVLLRPCSSPPAPPPGGVADPYPWRGETSPLDTAPRDVGGPRREAYGLLSVATPRSGGHPGDQGGRHVEPGQEEGRDGSVSRRASP